MNSRDRELLETIIEQMAANAELALKLLTAGVSEDGVRVFVDENALLAEMGSKLSAEAASVLQTEVERINSKVLGALAHSQEPRHG